MSVRPAGISRHAWLVATMVVLVTAMTACGSHTRKPVLAPPTSASTTTTSTTVPRTTTTVRRARVTTCPLTGVPAPGGKVPQRPALAVKVENLPVSRPPFGLGRADVIYEEPVEGGITRFIVIFQCQDAPRIEPVRSGRLIDPDLVSQYGAHPLFAYAGAIPPVVAKVDASSLVDVGVYQASAAYWRDSGRYAPHNLVSSTAVLYAAGVAEHAPSTPPAPVFQYGALPPTATPAGIVHIGYLYSDLTWTWQPQTKTWLRSYADTGLANLGDGGTITATNVVVMKVVIYPSQYVEDPTGTHENLLVLTGSGPLQVFRNGAVINGTWNRPTLAHLTQLLDARGHPIPLAPGQTWVELVPTTVGVTVTP
jgi:hypothetical protein